MAISIHQLQEELASCRKGLDKARQRRKEAVLDEQVMERKHDALNTLLSVMKGNGATLLPSTSVSDDQQPSGQKVAEESPNNKTQQIFQLVASSGESGVTAVDIWKQLQKQFETSGTKMHRNYLYAVLDRLGEQGKISERRGKYYRKEAEEKASE